MAFNFSRQDFNKLSFLLFPLVFYPPHQSSYFTAFFPYGVLIVLFFRCVFLEGASKGITFYVTPQWAQLKNVHVWVNSSSSSRSLFLEGYEASVLIFLNKNHFTFV